MKNTGCKHCEELCESFKITHPGDLAKAIRVVRDNLLDGTIIESDYWPSKHIKMDMKPFAKLDPKGPWEDYLEYYFECTRCHQLFRLATETYHDGGGEWEPVDRTGM